MKKLIAACFVVFFASACVVTNDSCDCYYDDPPTCLNAIDLGVSCLDDCYWDVVDCDADCYADGYFGGYCMTGVASDYCVCD